MSTMMYRPGPCIRLTKNTTSAVLQYAYAGDEVYILPMDQDFTLSTTQELQEPIKELFQYLEEAVIGVAGDAGGSTGATISRTMLELSNLTGFQLGSKGYHSKAWKGALPSSFSLTLRFFRGMTGVWSSKDEVYDPARHLYGLTLPYEPQGGGGVLPPMPSPVDVFTAFSAGVIQDAIAATSNVVGSGLSAIVSLFSQGKNSVSDLVSKTNTNLKSAVTSFFSGQTWEIAFGYYAGKATGMKDPYLRLQRYISESSTIKYSTIMELGNDKNYYPTSADVTISFVSEDFLTSGNFGDIAGQALYAQPVGKNH